MKFVTSVAFLIAVIVVAVNSRLHARLTEPEFQECQSKTGATEDYLENAVSNFMNGVSEIRVRYCLISCLAKKIGTMDKNNRLNFTRIAELGRPKVMQTDKYEKAVDSLKICSTKFIPGTDECSAMEHLMHCSINLMRNHTNAANIVDQYRKQ